jgi:hypothetical protein
MAQNRLNLTIAGIECEIRCNGATLLALLSERYEAFRSHPPDPCVIVAETAPYEVLEARFPNVAWDESHFVELQEEADRLHIWQWDKPFVATLDLGKRRGTLSILDNVYCLDSYLRLLYALLLAREGGFLLHASAIIRDGQGYAFFGPSGSGKTTVARLAEGMTLLSDELVAIRPVDGVYHVFGTPFGGDLAGAGQDASAPLRALFRLQKDMRTYLRPMGPAEAVAELYACIFFPAPQTQLMRHVFEACCLVTETLPTYVLHFRKERALFQELHRTIDA